MLIIHKIKMALDRRGVPPTVDAVQGNKNSRVVEIALFCGNQPWEVPEGASAMVRFRKPDGTGGIYDTLEDGSSALTVTGNVITAILAKQMLTVPGTVRAQVELTKGDQELATFTFVILVEPDHSIGAMESEDYINLSGYVASEVDRVLANQGTAFWVAAKLDYETGSASVSESAEAIYAAYEAKKPCYMRAQVTNPVSDAYQILVLQSAQKSNTGNGGKYYRLVFQTTSSVEIESEVTGGWITVSYLDEVVVSSFEGTKKDVCFRTQISPNANKLTIGEQVYDGSVAVDMTDTVNGMIEAKGRILLWNDAAFLNAASCPAGTAVSIPSDNYTGLEVIFVSSKGAQPVTCSSGFLPIGIVTSLCAIGRHTTKLASRVFSYDPKNSEIVFQIGYIHEQNSASEAVMLPVRIYGYK